MYECLRDGLGGFDALIGGFDFDCTWPGSLGITPFKDARCGIAYRAGFEAYE